MALSTSLHVPIARRNVRVSEWLAAIIVVLGIVGMAFASPPLVGPDEAAHQATASYLTVHFLPPKAETEDYEPGILHLPVCMAFNSAQDASCSIDRTQGSPGMTRIFNYPPLYYWVVGLGQKAAPGADTWLDVGGRVASLLLNVAGLTLLALLVRRRYRSWGTYLLLVTTPMAAFLWAVVNPNGWEVTTGLLFAYFLSQVWWGPPTASDHVAPRWFMLTALGVSSFLFGWSRHEALVWLVLLLVSVVAMGRSKAPRSHQGWILAIAMIGVIPGLAWQVTHPAQHVDHNPDRVLSPTLLDHLHWLNQIDAVLPDRVRQMVGVVGSLDTPVPQWMVIVLIAGWAALGGILYARKRIPAIVLVMGFIGTVVVPSVMEMLRWNDWPYWYQGRITLSFTVPFLFVFLLRYAHRGRRAAVVLSIVSGGVLTFMVAETCARYAFGIKDYIPLRLSDPAVGVVPLMGSLVAVSAMLLLTFARVVLEFGPRSRHSEASS